MQQPQRTEPTLLDPHWLADLRQRPSLTILHLNGKEGITSAALAYRAELPPTGMLMRFSTASGYGDRFALPRMPSSIISLMAEVFQTFPKSDSGLIRPE